MTMLLLAWTNTFFTPAFILAWTHVLSSFGESKGIELPLELLDEGVSAGGKSMDFARRINFPLRNADNGVELPPNAEELNAPTADNDENDNLEDGLSTRREMPKWLQMQVQRQAESHQHPNYHHSNMLTKHTQSGKHHSVGRQVHSSATSSATSATSALRRCSIEISSKIPGVCQVMGSIGNACVSGDYVDVFNAECL